MSFFFCTFIYQEFKVNRKAKKNKAMSSHLDQTSLNDGQKEGFSCGTNVGNPELARFTQEANQNTMKMHFIFGVCGLSLILNNIKYLIIMQIV